MKNNFNLKYAGIAGVFIVALALRLIGLTWGLPTREHWYSYHPDEAQMLSAILSIDIFSGDFNPGFFNYPSLYIYLSSFMHLVASGFGLTHAPSNDLAQSALFARDVLLSARVVTALLGAVTAPLVYLTVRQIGGEKIGILAGLLMAFLPGHLQHSHFATVDVPATFFIALCVWLSIRALREDVEKKWCVKQLYWAALVAGLAAATKYNAGLVVIVPLIAWLYQKKQQQFASSGALAIIALCGAGFLIGCPYSILDFPNFWGDGQNMGVAYELLVHPKQGHGDVFLETGNGWIYHATFNAPFLMSVPLLLVSVMGIVYTRIKKRRETCMLFTWLALYFFALGFSQVRFLRYLLLLAPALCVFAGCAFVALRAYRPSLTRVAGVLVLLLAVWGAYGVLYPFAVADSRDNAAAWMAQTVGSPATPVTVGMQGAPWFYSLPLSPLDSPPYRALSPEQLLELSGNRYQFVFTGFEASKLQSEKPEFFVLSEFEWRERERLGDEGFNKFMEALKQDYNLAIDFKNNPPLALPGRAFVPHDFLYPNPEVRIYRRKG